MAKQNVTVNVPEVPAFPADNNPASVSEPATPPGATADGQPVSPAVARAREGAAAAQGYGTD